MIVAAHETNAGMCLSPPGSYSSRGERSRPIAVDAFWADLGRLLDEMDIPTEGTFNEVKAHRRIRFFDTAERELNGNRYIFRERIDMESDERQMTLKYRHPDRYTAQDRDMDTKWRSGDVKTKFEEDVKPPFVSVFSYSTTVQVDPEEEFARVDQIAEVFPGLADKLSEVDTGGDLSVVRDFTARELVLVGAALLLGKRDIEAECAMVIWHDDGAAETPPVCVEFSFKYGNDAEDYRGTVTRDAYDVLNAFHTGLAGWVHPEPMTKTAFVYG